MLFFSPTATKAESSPCIEPLAPLHLPRMLWRAPSPSISCNHRRRGAIVGPDCSAATIWFRRGSRTRAGVVWAVSPLREFIGCGHTQLDWAPTETPPFLTLEQSRRGGRTRRAFRWGAHRPIPSVAHQVVYSVLTALRERVRLGRLFNPLRPVASVHQKGRPSLRDDSKLKVSSGSLWGEHAGS